jgi:5-methylcytosine-specific restriction protein B
MSNAMDRPTASNPLLLWTAMVVLRDAGHPLEGREVLSRMAEWLTLTPHWLEQYKSGQVRWEVGVQFFTGDAATIGWMTKLGGWAITEAGLEALETFASPEELYAERGRRYNLIDQRRKQAQQNLSDVQQFIDRTLGLVEAGSWTAHDDLAELAGTTPQEVADFLASGKIRLANGYRVLNSDGTVPAEGMLNAVYRGTDLRARLVAEGVNFDERGAANQQQRLMADALKDLIAAESESEHAEAVPSVRRAWMVRGSNVDGYDLVPEWLDRGFVSLSASQLSGVDASAAYEQIQRAVESGYEHKSYAYRSQRLEEFDRFLRKMQPTDLVLATRQGKAYLGRLEGTAYLEESEQGLSNLRRPVRWLNAADPADAGLLRPPVPALLQNQAYVADLTEAYQQLAGLVPRQAEPEPTAAPEPLPPPRPLEFRPVTAEFAEELLLDQAELSAITDLLWERRQIVLYGPPGTGKTYLATKLARQLTDEGSVKLVQFHPSYAYEDFFEGFRPSPGGSGTLTFELRPGPFRAFAEAAAANTTTPYILIIDEINRANLAKVFGELYFLLEYRDSAISLQYSPDKEFTLPENLFIIGTMNTADRSIARVDAAMRRRFAFVELHPRIPPVRGLLGRWLRREGLPGEAAQLLDELNRRIEDSDAAIGPSYLMRREIYEQADGLERVWRYDLMPLIEDMFYGQRDLAQLYSLPNLRRAVAARTPGPVGEPASSSAATEPDSVAETAEPAGPVSSGVAPVAEHGMT